MLCVLFKATEERITIEIHTLKWDSMKQVGFPGGSAVKNPPVKGRRCQFHPWVRKTP